MSTETNVTITPDDCLIETEIEWRTRLSLENAQRVLQKWFKGRTYCTVEEYRLRRYTRYHRRIGARVHHVRYDFDTIGDYLSLHGLNYRRGDDRPPRTRTTTAYDLDHTNLTEYFSNVKTTNCAHMIFYPFRSGPHRFDDPMDEQLTQLWKANRDTKSGVIGNGVKIDANGSENSESIEIDNVWVQLFLFKRSLEMNNAFLDVNTLEGAEFVEMEKSDNNLGCAVVRKISRFLQCRRQFPSSCSSSSASSSSASSSSRNHDKRLEFRLALYSIMDEYQQIRYELAIEYEFENELENDTNESRWAIHDYTSVYQRNVLDNLNHGDSSLEDNACHTSRMVRRVDSKYVKYVLDAMSYVTRCIVGTALENSENTMIQLNIDWISDDVGVPCNGKPLNAGDREFQNNESTLGEEDREEGGRMKKDDCGGEDMTAGTQNDPDNHQLTEEETDGNDTEDTDTLNTTASNDDHRRDNERFVEDQTEHSQAEEMNNLNAKLLSLTLTANENGSVENFLRFVGTEIVPRWTKGAVLLRKKLDGRRVYVTYDGQSKLYCDNGHMIDLEKIYGSGTDHTRVFSTNFIYQMEMYRDPETRCLRYAFTEVIAVRNNYASQLNALCQSFSPSTMPYSYEHEQQWPYGLDGTGLSDHETRAILQFWGCSSCDSTNGSKLVRKVVERLREPAAGRVASTKTTGGTDRNHHRNCPSDEDVDENGEATDDDHQEDDVLQIDIDPLELDELNDQTGATIATRSTENDGTTDTRENTTNHVTTTTTRKAATKACTGCVLRTVNSIRNTGLRPPFVNVRGVNHNFVYLSVDDSLEYLRRIDNVKSQVYGQRHDDRATIHVNVPLRATEITPEQLMDKFERFYRYAILRLTDILFLSNKPEDCVSFLRTHFDGRDAERCVEGYRCQRSTLAHMYQDKDPIDGFLIYVSKERTACKKRAERMRLRGETECCRPNGGRTCELVARSPCAYDYTITTNEQLNWQYGMSMKLKPFQTIELLLQIRPSGDQRANDRGDLVDFHFCTKATIPEQQIDLAAHTYFYAGNVRLGVANWRAEWKRVDGTTITIHMDPRIDLIDKNVYEFTCYNETIFFLVANRPDKILPDTEKKVNSIVFSRKKFSPILRKLIPL